MLVHKEVDNAVAEVAQEEVTEEATWVQAVINNTPKDHLNNNQVLSHNNNLTIPNSNNNKSHHNNMEWFNVVTTQLWELLNNHYNNKFHYCLFQKLTCNHSTKLLIPMKRSNLLVTPCILISNKLSANNMQVKLLVCWLMRMQLISTYYSQIKVISLKKQGKLWVFYPKHKCNLYNPLTSEYKELYERVTIT